MVVITEERARAKEIDIETGLPPFTQKHSGEMTASLLSRSRAALSRRAGIADLTQRRQRSGGSKCNNVAVDSHCPR
jgi:hypothetical protein